MLQKAKMASRNCCHTSLSKAKLRAWKSGAMNHAAQFTKNLEEIANYMQKNYNSDVAKMIKDMECPVSVFEFPDQHQKLF